MSELVARAERLADGLLFPSAVRVDVAGRIPPGHLDRLADEGFYGLAVDAAPAAFHRVVEVLAAGCLATTFVWLQHQGALRAVADSPHHRVRAQWREPLHQGKKRAGVALGALRPGPAAVRATPVDGGYLLDGEAPWVTGWGLVDVLHTAARDPDDTIIWALVDAAEAPTLRVRPLDMMALQATRTVHMRLDRHFVPAERVTGSLPYAQWPPHDAAGLRTNGSLALGVAGRCCRLLGPGPLDEELTACRSALDAAGPEALPSARAAASALTMRAATTLTAAAGARAILIGEDPQRLAREALFLLVFGSRPAIRSALVPLLRGG